MVQDPEDIPFGPPVDRSKPQHHFFAEEEQYRVKVQKFTAAPTEYTVQKISFDRDVDRYRRAAERGFSHVSTPRRRQRDPSVEPDQESVERSQRRAKIAVRLLATELAPNALVTFTTRGALDGGLDALLDIWKRFNRLADGLGVAWQYVAVPEPHKANPDHFHIHAAVRGEVSIKTLRRLWHIAIEAHHGRIVSTTLYGPAAPGNIDVQAVKGREGVKRIAKIAKYIAKYITKDLVQRFNRKRYWPSRGINLQDARAFWLSSTNQWDAIREAAEMFFCSDGISCHYKTFSPSDRICWWREDPDNPPPAPF